MTRPNTDMSHPLNHFSPSIIVQSLQSKTKIQSSDTETLAAALSDIFTTILHCMLSRKAGMPEIYTLFFLQK